MGLHFLIFMWRNLENKKKLTLVQIMNSVGMNSKNIIYNVNISMIMLLWVVFSMNTTGMNSVSCE